jgi:CDP-glucose 4,6-dehydratase
MENTVGALLKHLNGPILVTGHTGFKGTWLMRYLRELEIEAIGYSLSPRIESLYARAGLLGENVEQFGDIGEINQFSEFAVKHKPAVILHLAAQALVPESYVDPIGTFKTNVMGTANVLQVAKSLPGLMAVGVVTTDKVYQNQNDGKRYKESDPMLGSDPYSASKAASENVIEAWRHIPSKFQDFPIVSLRAGNVIAGGDLSNNRLIPDLVRSFQTGEKAVIRNPNSTRPWQHVLDPLTGYLLAIGHALLEKKNENFTFGPRETSLAVVDVVKVFQERWKNLSVSYSQGMDAKYESKLLELDSTHATKTLNWNPVYDQYSSIKKTIDWWESNLQFKKSPINCIDEQIKDYVDTFNSDS